ncbi:unnamed protein product [Closterium sp. Naga37s-1]|nr:unnamed protein product [Closterium sp. Naga37s-1]
MMTAPVSPEEVLQKMMHDGVFDSLKNRILLDLKHNVRVNIVLDVSLSFNPPLSPSSPARTFPCDSNRRSCGSARRSFSADPDHITPLPPPSSLPLFHPPTPSLSLSSTQPSPPLSLFSNHPPPHPSSRLSAVFQQEELRRRQYTAKLVQGSETLAPVVEKASGFAWSLMLSPLSGGVGEEIHSRVEETFTRLHAEKAASDALTPDDAGRDRRDDPGHGIRRNKWDEGAGGGGPEARGGDGSRESYRRDSDGSRRFRAEDPPPPRRSKFSAEHSHRWGAVGRDGGRGVEWGVAGEWGGGDGAMERRGSREGSAVALSPASATGAGSGGSRFGGLGGTVPGVADGSGSWERRGVWSGWDGSAGSGARARGLSAAGLSSAPPSRAAAAAAAAAAAPGHARTWGNSPKYFLKSAS